MKTIVLDFDDFSAANHNLFYLNKLHELYPDMKVSMFYIPVDYQYGNVPVEVQEESLKLIRQAVKDGWIELIPHGMMHIPAEFAKTSYKDMELVLKAYKEYFKKQKLPYVKGFKAPYWLISQEAIDCLNDNGWFLAIDRNQPLCLKAKRNYVYNWSIDESFPFGQEIIYGHGHISLPSKNALPESILNLSRIPRSYTWKFISEVMK